MWGSLAIAGSSLISGFLGSQAAGDAADATRDAANTSAGVQRDMFNAIASNLSPWTQGGTDAMKRLMFLSGVGAVAPTDLSKVQAPKGAMSYQDFMGTFDQPAGREWSADEKANIDKGYRDYLSGVPGGKRVLAGEGPGYGSLTQTIDDRFHMKPFSFTMDDFKTDPGYQFVKDQGEQGIMRAQNAMGQLRGSGTLKSLMRYDTGLASQEYGKSYGRAFGEYTTSYGQKLQEFMTNLGIKTGNMERPFNMLSALSGMGLNAGAQTGMAGTNMANNTSAGILQAGAAAGQSAIAGAGAWSQAFQGGMSNYLTMNRWNDMMKVMDQGRNPLSTGLPGQYSLTNPQYGG